MHGGVEPAHFGLQLGRAGDQFLQFLRQQRQRFGIARLAGGKPNLALFLVGLGERHFALFDRAMQQKPGRKLHQPRGQPHAFCRVNQAGAALELLRFRAAGAVEIARGFFHQRHAVAKQRREHLGTRQPFAEGDRAPTSIARLSDIYASHTADETLPLQPAARTLRSFKSKSGTHSNRKMALESPTNPKIRHALCEFVPKIGDSRRRASPQAHTQHRATRADCPV